MPACRVEELSNPVFESRFGGMSSGFGPERGVAGHKSHSQPLGFGTFALQKYKKTDIQGAKTGAAQKSFNLNRLTLETGKRMSTDFTD